MIFSGTVAKKKPLRIGLIGLGYIGNVHLMNSKRISDAYIMATADLSKKALRKAKEIGIQKTFTDYTKLLREPQLDAVVIALPTHLHERCAVEAIEAGKHLLLEKPIARNTREAARIVSAARRNSIKLMMGYPLRFMPNFVEGKKTIEQGIIGDVEVANATLVSSGPFYHRQQEYIPAPVPEWWFNREYTGGGALIDLGSHLINILRWYFGEAKKISSVLSHRFNMDFEDSTICLTEFESGTKSTINVGWFSQEHILEMDLFGTVRRHRIATPKQSIYKTAIQMLVLGTSSAYQAHMNELQYFVDCMRKDKMPSPSGEDGLKDLETIERAYRNNRLFDENRQLDR